MAEKKEKNIIWKYKHTSLKDRKTSSGLTFWPERVKTNEQR